MSNRQKKPNYYCIIMAGGIGARFWPASTTQVPKQFIDILGDGATLIQKTFNRCVQIFSPDNIYIVTNAMYADLVKVQLPEISDNQLVLEPMRRNTAPCIAYANHKIKRQNPNAIITVVPSDHNIEEEAVFLDIISKGMEAVATNNWLLTIGVRPSYPNTGYGYIQYDEDKMYADNSSIFAVKMFTEKPELQMAKQFVESGEFLWNSGIFMWSLKAIEAAFEEFLPEVNRLFKEAENAYDAPEEKEVINQVYQVCRNISIDYGIMESAKNVHVYAAADFGWSDLGTWGALYEVRKKNGEGNTVIGKKVKIYGSKNCIVSMPKNKVAVIQGLDDYIVVENENILLICHKNEEQQIRQFVTDVQIDFGDQYI